MKATLTVLVTLASFVFSQQNFTNSSMPMFPCLIEPELDNIIPNCAKECQQMALAHDGCDDYDDVACHCSRTEIIGEILAPCLLFNSSCGSNDTVGEQNLQVVIIRC
jgi:hypothetical protein